jgi:hypothetical protein
MKNDSCWYTGRSGPVWPFLRVPIRKKLYQLQNRKVYVAYETIYKVIFWSISFIKKIYHFAESIKSDYLKITGTYDIEQQRIIDTIKCIGFREARDVDAEFINRQWAEEKIQLLTRFVTDWWENPYDQCFVDYSNAGPKLKLSQVTQD